MPLVQLKKCIMYDCCNAVKFTYLYWKVIFLSKRHNAKQKNKTWTEIMAVDSMAKKIRSKIYCSHPALRNRTQCGKGGKYRYWSWPLYLLIALVTGSSKPFLFLTRQFLYCIKYIQLSKRVEWVTYFKGADCFNESRPNELTHGPLINLEIN